MAKPKKPKNPLIPTYRVRHDGWTEVRTRTFLATLRQTGCVRDACRVIGMSFTSGYRLYEKDGVFAKAWDAALVDARRGLVAVAHERAVVGKETVIIRGGEEVERRITPSDSMLALLLKRGDLRGLADSEIADQVITIEEWNKGIRFDGWGKKYEAQSDEDVRKTLDAKLNLMRERLLARKAKLGDEDERTINIKTGDGVDEEIIAAVMGFASDKARVVKAVQIETAIPRKL